MHYLTMDDVPPAPVTSLGGSTPGKMTTTNGFLIEEILHRPIHLYRRWPPDDQSDDDRDDPIFWHRDTTIPSFTLLGALASVMEHDEVFARFHAACQLEIEMNETSILAWRDIDSIVQILREYRASLASETLSSNSVSYLLSTPETEFPIIRLRFARPEAKLMALSVIDRHEAISGTDEMISFLEEARVDERDVEFDV